jgi:NAD-dependent dihydropyrimidine dehydrogenase PreA subunit
MPDSGRATSNHAAGIDHDCAEQLRQSMRDLGEDATVSTERPVVATPYTYVDGRICAFTCPHGVTFYLEPTSEQIAQWAAEEAR